MDQRVTLRQADNAIKQIWEFCVNGALAATTRGEGISPDKWRTLEIRLIDHIPTVVFREYPKGPGAGAHPTPDLRFRREEVLRCFPPPDVSLYTKIPDVEPSQLGPKIAHRALRQLYPEGCVPSHISDEVLARRASTASQKTISREDIRRALGKRK
jgi:hypothetical protein